MLKLTKKSAGWLIITAVLVSTLACQRSNPQNGGQKTLLPPTQLQPAGQSTLPPAPTATPAGAQQPTQAVATQPPATPVSPTLMPPPTTGLSGQIQAQGDALEDKLNQLDQMNQSADNLEDVPK